MKSLSFKKQYSIKGFTLIETLFAIVIFSLALVSLMAVVSQGIVTTKNSTNEMTAAYLNQEALEALRWWRDTERARVVAATAPGVSAALVMPATVDHIRSISEHQERMPAKSTYFYPKLLSGLVFNPLC